MIRTICSIVGASLIVACTKPDATPTPAPSASVAVVPSASAAPSATVATSATASAAPMASGSAAPVDCGSKEKPCPLQGWMKENMQPAMNKPDLPAVAVALDKSASFAPAGYTNWASIAKDGAAAARSGDMTATKASCRTCHDQYKQKYKDEMRARKI